MGSILGGAPRHVDAPGGQQLQGEVAGLRAEDGHEHPHGLAAEVAGADRVLGGLPDHDGGIGRIPERLREPGRLLETAPLLEEGIDVGYAAARTDTLEAHMVVALEQVCEEISLPGGARCEVRMAPSEAWAR